MGFVSHREDDLDRSGRDMSGFDLELRIPPRKPQEHRQQQWGSEPTKTPSSESRRMSAAVSLQDVREAVRAQGLESRVRDKTSVGGRLWIKGGWELASTLRPLRLDYRPNGGGPFKGLPAWHTTNQHF